MLETWACAAGILGGFAVTVLFWGLAQIVWSYRVVPTFDRSGLGTIASGLPHLVNVVTGLLGGALLGRTMAQELQT